MPPVAGAITQEIIDVFAVLNGLRVAFPPSSLRTLSKKSSLSITTNHFDPLIRNGHALTGSLGGVYSRYIRTQRSRIASFSCWVSFAVPLSENIARYEGRMIASSKARSDSTIVAPDGAYGKLIPMS
jgi:hypothetical protein